MSPSPSRTRIVFTALVLLLLSGCASLQEELPDRLNHLHDAGNQKIADGVKSGLDKATSGREGIGAQMLQNIAAQSALRKAVLEETNRLFELTDLLQLDDTSWSALASTLYLYLGWDFLINNQALYTDIVLDVMLTETANPSLEGDELEALRNLALFGAAYAEVSATPDFGMVNLAGQRTSLNDLSVPVDRILLQHPEALSRRAITDSMLAPIPDEQKIEKLSAALRRAETAKTFAGDSKTAARSEAFTALGLPAHIGQGLASAKAVKAFKNDDDLAKALVNATAKNRSLDALGAMSSEEAVFRINRRLVLLSKVLQVFDVLIKGERARRKLIEKSAGRQFKKVGKSLACKAADKGEDDSDCTADGAAVDDGGQDQEAGPEVAADKIAAKVSAMKTALTEYWSDELEQRAFEEEASELQKMLLVAAAKSRDPAAVYSLVPLAGDGLGDDDLSRLEEYVTFLSGLADDKPCDAADAGSFRVWECELESRGQGQEGAQAQGAGQDGSQKPTKNLVSEFLDSLDALRNTTLEVDPSAEDTSAGASKLDSVLKSVLGIADQLGLDLALDKAETSRQPGGAAGAPEADGERALESALLEPLQALLEGEGEGLSAESISALLSVVLEPGQRDNKGGAALSPEEREEIEKRLSAIADDIRSESEAAARRLVDLLRSLWDLHQDVRDENVRHYLALAGIAAVEVERWQDLKAVGQDLKDIVDREFLFAENSVVDGWNRSARQHSAKAPAHPVIQPSDDVLNSVRRLAVTANGYQKAAPDAFDPDGSHTRRSAQRLADSIQILQGYQLLASINRRKAAENSVLLVAELQQHNIRLDEVVVSGTEAALAFHLERLAAFHSSGITDADVSALVSAVQSALLAWIGTEVN